MNWYLVLATLICGLFAIRNYVEALCLFHPEPLYSPLVFDGDIHHLTSGARLYTFPAGSNNSLLFLHGNGGNVFSYRNIIELLVKNGWNVYALEYRGFGELHNHQVSTSSIETDVMEALNHREYKVAIGFSLGGVLLSHAIGLANVRIPAKVVMLNSMFSIRQVASYHIPHVSSFMSIDWSAERALDLTSPLYGKAVGIKWLVIQTKTDQVIPYSQVEEFIKHNVPMITLPSGGHNDSVMIHSNLWVWAL